VAEGLEPLPRTGGRQADDVVEDKMAFVERVVRPRKRDGTAAVRLEEPLHHDGIKVDRGEAITSVSD